VRWEADRDGESRAGGRGRVAGCSVRPGSVFRIERFVVINHNLFIVCYVHIKFYCICPTSIAFVIEELYFPGIRPREPRCSYFHKIRHCCFICCHCLVVEHEVSAIPDIRNKNARRRFFILKLHMAISCLSVTLLD
jgi:hypothetical protein